MISSVQISLESVVLTARKHSRHGSLRRDGVCVGVRAHALPGQACGEPAELFAADTQVAISLRGPVEAALLQAACAQP